MMGTSGKLRRALIAISGLAGLGILVVIGIRQLGEDPEVVAARKSIAERDFSSASQRLDTYLATFPDDLPARLLAAQTARRRGDLNDATTHLQILEDNHYSPDLLKKEQLLLAISRGGLSEAGESPDYFRAHPDDPHAVALLEAIITGTLRKLDPNTMLFPFDAHINDSKILDRAELLAGIWLETRREPVDQKAGLIWRARLRALKNDFPGAIADLGHALELDPDDFDRGFQYALWIAQGNPREAGIRFEELARRHPNDPKVMMTLATGYRSMGELERSAGILDKLIATHPTSGSLVERAHVYLDKEKPDLAEPLLLRALQLAPDNPDVVLALARCKRLKGENEQARLYQNQYLQLDKKNQKPKPMK